MNSFCSALVFLYLCARQINITTDETHIPYYNNLLGDADDGLGTGTHYQGHDSGR